MSGVKPELEPTVLVPNQILVIIVLYFMTNVVMFWFNVVHLMPGEVMLDRVLKQEGYIVKVKFQ